MSNEQRTVQSFSLHASIADDSKNFKISLKLLEDIYNNPKCLDHITKNSKWQSFIKAVHKLVTFEAELFNSSHAPLDKNRVMDMIMLKTAKLGNKYIDRSTFVAMITDILGHDRYNHYHNTYLTITKDYFLNQPIYMQSPTCQEWKNILSVLINKYNGSSTDYQKNLILTVIGDVIENGCRSTALSKNIIAMLGFIGTVFHDIFVHERNDVMNRIMNIAYTMYLHISSENALTLCAYAQKFLPDLVKMKDCNEKYKILSLFLQIYGSNEPIIKKCQDKFDIQKWKIIIQYIYQNVLLDNQDKESTELVNLGCEVYRLVLNDPTILSNDDSMKDFRISRLIDCKKENYSFTLLLIKRLLQKYQQLLTEEDFVVLLETVKNIFVDCFRNKDILLTLCDIAASLKTFESNFEKAPGETIKIWKNWNIISTFVLRAITINKVEELNYEILRFVVKNETRFDTTVFLNLVNFISKTKITFPVMADLILIFCKDFLWKRLEDPDSKKLQLLKSVLNIPWEELSFCIPISTLSYIITCLVRGSMETCHQNLFKEDTTESVTYFIPETFHETMISSLNQISKYHKNLNFTTDLFQMGKVPEFENQNNSSTIVIQTNKRFLMTKLTDLATKVLNPENDTPLSRVILHIVFLVKLTADLKKSHVIADTESETQTLRSLTRESFSKVVSKLTELDIVETDFEELMNIFESLFILYSKSYDDESSKMIRSETTVAMLKHLFTLPKTNHEVMQEPILSNQHINHHHRCQKKSTAIQTTKQELLKSCTIRILTAFCCFTLQQNAPLEQHGMVLKILLSGRWVSETSVSDIQILVKMLETFSRIPAEHHCHLYLDSLVKLSMPLFCKMHTNVNISSSLLRILPRLFYLATCLPEGSTWTIVNLSTLFYNFHQMVSENLCGLPVALEFVDCLRRIIQMDSPKLSALLKRDSETMLFDVLLSCLTSQFYPVRLEGARCVYLIFSCSRTVTEDWKRDFFRVTLSNVWLENMLQSTRKPRHEFDKMDFDMTRAATIAATIGAVICSGNEAMQCEALLLFCRLKVKLQIDSSFAIQFLDKLRGFKEDLRYIVDKCLNFLLVCWLQSESNFSDFPADLLGFSSQKEFYESHLQNLFCMLISDGRYRSQVPQFCEIMELSFGEVFELSFVSVVVFLFSNQRDEYARELWSKLKAGDPQLGLSRSYKNLLKDNLHTMFIYTVARLNDGEYLNKIFDTDQNVLPDDKFLDPPQFRFQEVCGILAILESELDLGEGNLMKHLVIKNPSKLQEILTYFSLELNNKKLSVKWRFRALLQYLYISELIGRVLNCDYFSNLCPYVIRDISYTLVHLMKDTDSNALLANCVGICMHSFLEKCLQSRSTFIHEHLNIYVTSLSRQFQLTTPKHEMALRTFRLLFIENRLLLPNLSDKTNPIPDPIRLLLNLPKVDENLETIVRRFVKNNVVHDERDIDDAFVADHLAYLKEQMSLKRAQLQDLIAGLDDLSGFSEDCATSLVHQLIHRLVKYSRSSVIDIRLQAISCLGILGLTELNTMTLYPDKLFTEEVVDCATTLTYQIVSLLTHFLVKNDVHLRKASCDALYGVLNSVPDSWVKQLPSERVVRELEAAMAKKKHSWHRTNLENHLRVELLFPFIFCRSLQNQTTFQVDDQEFSKLMLPSGAIWTVQSQKLSCQHWTRDLCTRLANCLTNSYIKTLVPVFQLSTNLCVETLPKMLYVMVREDKARLNKLSQALDAFFASHQVVTSKTKETVQCMLNVANYIRVQSNGSFEVDCLKVAQAALACNSIFTATLYVETWTVEFLNRNPQKDLSLPVIDYVYLVDPASGKALHGILKEVYKSIGLSDVIYSCSGIHCRDRSSLIKYYKDTSQWDKVLLMCDVELQSQEMTKNEPIEELFNALHHLDLHRLVLSMQNLHLPNNSEVSNYVYESAWRLSDWGSIPTREKIENLEHQNGGPNSLSGNDYALYRYKALKLLHDSKLGDLNMVLNEARESIIGNLHNISFESSSSIKPYLSEIQMLQEIEDMSQVHTENELLELHLSWKNQRSLYKVDFSYKESVLRQRMALLQLREVIQDGAAIKGAITSTCLDLMELAKQNGRMRLILHLIDELKSLKDVSEDVKFELEFQKANTVWTAGNLEQGRRSLQNLLRDDRISVGFRAKCLEASATWAAESQAEHPQDIAKAFQDALDTCRTAIDFGETDDKTLLKARLNMARFVDKEYLSLSERMKSSHVKVLKQGVEGLSDLSDPRNEKNKDIRVAKHYKKMNLEKDAKELEEMETQKNMYLLLATKCYAQNLAQSDGYDGVVFRLIALWLANIDNVELTTAMQQYIPTIPSYKFLPLIPQLVPRLNSPVPHFATIIKKLIFRCAKEHPYHTLPALLAMKHQFEDLKYKEKPENVNCFQDSKTAQAARLVEELKEHIAEVIQQTEHLNIALISLAYWKTKAKGSSEIAIPRNQDLTKIRDFSKVAVPTLHIHVRPDANYSNIVTVLEYKKTFQFVGGVNAPKKIVCVGSDGIHRSELVKGQDDMKQDAMMQQIFSVMNVLLNSDEDASKSKLKIRTYKIVPLSQRSGILEWCKNTAPLAPILTGKEVRKKYYPNDWTSDVCKNKLMNAETSSDKEKYRVFNEICRHFHPVFHHIFIELYQSPEVWFERKLNYTRSVAVSSIIGYILGIGDRHLSNILFDQNSAEVVHIDFGYAFDQGKVLPIPELVPFRLTRNIEAAMGVYGAQGIMKHNCVQTIKVLRKNHETILMLLEVLLYDPIYLWSSLPLKSVMSSMGNMANLSNDSQENSIAKKSLWKVQQKLQGTEQCIQVDVTCQVETLIQEARNPHNLSRMYYGWQPFL